MSSAVVRAAGRARSGTWWRSSDWVLVGAALACTVMGVLAVWSATWSGSGAGPAVRQGVFAAVGMVAAAVLARADLRWLRAVSWWGYGLSVLGLLVVLSPLGATVNGSRSWIALPFGASLQPAELAKVALVVVLAAVLSSPSSVSWRPPVRPAQVLVALGVAGLPVLLVLAQPDLGSAVVLMALTLGVVTASGAPARWPLGLVALGTATVAGVLVSGLLQGYQQDRLVAFADPSADPQGIGYQTRQVRIAIGSGGLDGQGLLRGGQTQGGFVPYGHTDFVFAVVGEELGFLGAGLLLVLLSVLLWRGLCTAWEAADLFGRLVASGVVCWLAFQVFQNVGMNLGIVPVTGLPLPFVSAGGSSMVAAWAAVGLLLGVRATGTTPRPLHHP